MQPDLELVRVGPDRSFGARVHGHPHRTARRLFLPMADGRGVTDIRFEVGFGDVSNFDRQFLAHEGASPSRLRAPHRPVVAPAEAPARPRRPATTIPNAETPA